MRRKLLMFMVLFIVVSGMLAADETGSAFHFSGFPTDTWAARVFAGYTGLSFIDGQETSIETTLSGGWLTRHSYYSGSFDNRELPSVNFNDADTLFHLGFIQDLFGIRQGFIRNNRNGKNLVEGFLYYRGRWEAHVKPDGTNPWFFSLSDNPEKTGIFINAAVTGLAYNNSVRNSHGVKDGLDAKISFEYAPAGINGTADYYSTVCKAMGYLPLYDSNPENRMNLFSVYLADRIRIAANGGSYRPFTIRREDALQLRGFERERTDSRFTAVNNMDIRINLPSLFIPDIKLGLLGFFDSGFYYEDSSYNGTLFSTGAALYLDLFGAFQGGVRYNYLLKGERMDTKKDSIDLMLTYYF